MSKQDRNGVRTAQDIERKYDLSSLVNSNKALRVYEDKINKTLGQVENFVAKTLKDIESLQSQMDGNTTIFFHSGVPTMENFPASEWTDCEVHLGDLYYDTDTGKAYRFARDGDNYSWLVVTDVDVVEALELARNAKDTADGKRRVFVVTPIPPYDVGDLWLNEKELYVCVKPKKDVEKYEEDDFEKAVKYTDDSALVYFLENDFVEALKEINGQIDKKAETWYQGTDPSVGWTDSEKDNHVNDIWYNTSDENSYIYTSEHEWVVISATIPEELFDELDGKAQIFTDKPTPPYYKNDLYVQGANGDIFVCISDRTEGSYNASDWKKASKYTDDSALNSFVENVYNEAIKSLNTQIDNKITTWYAVGEPSLKWETEEENKAHCGDMYYDKDTGYAYRFEYENGAYKWSIIRDIGTIEALAIANSAKDTADGKRRVFTETPYPPYDNGDIWFKNGEIYICQISKPEDGTYEENDFIVATIYTDDTVANKVGDELKVLQGTVTTIKKTQDTLTQTVENNEKNLRADLKLKVDVNALISKINASADVIELKGNRFIVISDNLTISEDGTITAKAGEIADFDINEYGLTYGSIDSGAYTKIAGDGIRWIAGIEEQMYNEFAGRTETRFENRVFQFYQAFKEAEAEGFELTPVGGLDANGMYTGESLADWVNSPADYLVTWDGYAKFNRLDMTGNIHLKNTMALTAETNDGTSKLITGINANNYLLFGVTDLNSQIRSKGLYITSTSAGLTNRQYGVNKVLWSGGLYMSASHTATLSETITAQPNGVVLIWSGYNNGVQNYQFHFTFVPKYFVSSYNGGGITVALYGASFALAGAKYVYISDTKIVGSDYNTQTGTNKGITFANNQYVLREVIGV